MSRAEQNAGPFIVPSVFRDRSAFKRPAAALFRRNDDQRGLKRVVLKNLSSLNWWPKKQGLEANMNTPARKQFRNQLMILWLASAFLIVAGCSTSPSTTDKGLRVQMPLKQGWFEGQKVFYITTDASDSVAAKELGANFSPRLANALPPASIDKASVKPPSAVDRVYSFPNFVQNNVFASAPKPVGYLSTESAYTPVWLMMTVTWNIGATPSVLTSEEDVLDAADEGLVVIASTGVIVNCPIVHRGSDGGMSGVSITR